MKENVESIGKILDIIRNIQQSTVDDPTIQSEIKKTLDKIGDNVKNAHSTLTKLLIEKIESDNSITEEEKKALIKKLTDENNSINGEPQS